MVIAAIDWTLVLCALIPTIPALIAAWRIDSVHRKITTPSGASIGTQVEDSHHVSLANNLLLSALGGKVKAPVPPAAVAQEARVTDLPDSDSTAKETP